MATYDIGDKVTCTATFTDTSGGTVGPSAVAFSYKDPRGTSGTASVSGTAGVYTATVELDYPGIWRYRFAGTGSYVAAEEGSFKVRVRHVTA